ncbi:hypothetical protein SEA_CHARGERPOWER_40 [Mycobacterium phage Chargerpower]|nr:hypothetical protein SEA_CHARGERPOWER_40 [Mycobacterium phage Chargerpower]
MKAFLELQRDARNGEGRVLVDVMAIVSVSEDSGATWVDMISGSGFYVEESVDYILGKMGEAFEHLE